MVWNYRVFRVWTPHGDSISLREVYYKEDDETVELWTGPVALDGFEDISDLETTLELMLKDVRKNRPIIDGCHNENT